MTFIEMKRIKGDIVNSAPTNYLTLVLLIPCSYTNYKKLTQEERKSE